MLFDLFGGGAVVDEGGAVSVGIGFGPEATEIVGASESVSVLGGSTGWRRSAVGRSPDEPGGRTVAAGGTAAAAARWARRTLLSESVAVVPTGV